MGSPRGSSNARKEIARVKIIKKIKAFIVVTPNAIGFTYRGDRWKSHASNPLKGFRGRV